ncbi:UDP-N-acetylmuramate dehydrogenase [Chitinophaga sp. GCM10012297]|uniref:UDP-N-acetylenolpyruvoylglucosamine reductase n=1 Tax=Chitinophaga chungangae TaxID=2821488 RepID=A0ABS3YKA8_9BACT|nr:UDP-N-acetylmuramate dehydrogenase [Chitinophaga chungangae]MBO9155096.1 UDP-N-acetylmuramate dehydrogenase [Chitinophaga chungangae]
MKIQENVSLRQYNTFNLDATARYFAAFHSREALEEILAGPQFKYTPKLILGGGSNILLTKDFDGLVLKNEIKGIHTVSEDEEHVYVKAGAGENWHQFVMHCIEKGYAGLENLSLIPGNVGASPMQNIGAYGVEIKDVFEELEALHLQEHTLVSFNREACAFGYRESVFKRQYKDQFAILQVIYKLSKKPTLNTSYGAIEQELERMGKTPSVRSVSEAVINIRSSKLPNPAEIGNAGSFFKNPEVTKEKYEELKLAFPNVVAYPLPGDHYKLAAGWLIEQSGWKGYRNGDAGVHARQALVLVNYGNARGEELVELSWQIVDSVKEKFGVVLEREVNII